MDAAGISKGLTPRHPPPVRGSHLRESDPHQAPPGIQCIHGIVPRSDVFADIRQGSRLTSVNRWKRSSQANRGVIKKKVLPVARPTDFKATLPRLRAVALPRLRDVALPRLLAVASPEKLEFAVEDDGSTLGSACLLQAFHWSSCQLKSGGQSWYCILAQKVEDIDKCGFTDVLLPPCSDAQDPQGFLPRDFYNLNSHYGTEAELRDLIAAMHKQGLRVWADLPINRLANVPLDGSSNWKRVGGAVDEEVDWVDWVGESGSKAITVPEPVLGEEYGGLPAIEHSNPSVQNDVKGWLLWLKQDVGFDAWCFDCAKAFDPTAVRIYCETTGALSIGDFWNPMRYNGLALEYDQDQHRQDLCNWVKATRATAVAIDYTTKGILQQAVGRCEYWRLIDPKGRPTGMIGWWPGKAVTFVDNHVTGSLPQHWPFPSWGVQLGYVYILTHPGIPCVFWDHIYEWNLKGHIQELVAIRRRNGIHARSQIRILACHSHLYMARIGDSVDDLATFRGVVMKIGPSTDLLGQAPGSDWAVTFCGQDFCIWERR